MVCKVGQADKPWGDRCGVEHGVEVDCEQRQLADAVRVAVERGGPGGHHRVSFGVEARNLERPAVGEVVEPGASIATKLGGDDQRRHGADAHSSIPFSEPWWRL